MVGQRQERRYLRASWSVTSRQGKVASGLAVTSPRQQQQTQWDLGRRSDAELLELSVVSADAFDVFYRRHLEGVLSYVASRVGDREVAFDLTSEVFAAALAGRDSFQSDKAPARAWLFGIANHKIADERRRGVKEAHTRRKLGIPRFELTDEALEQVEEMIDVSSEGFLQGLEDLSPAERAAIEARVISEDDYDKIAADQDTTQDVIRQRVSRGLAKLRALGKRRES
jgi:RNA polymerase sigma-70 factor (ECF subfamily)